MASTINLSRNTKLYFTTNVNSTSGAIITDTAVGTFTSANTIQIPVLDGFSFSQATTQSTIQISEAGDTPSRGQRAFNTALNPVEFSFSTYIRSSLTAAIGPVSAVEKVLWNALMGEATIDATGLAPTSIGRADATTAVASIVAPSPLSKVVNGATTRLGINDIINVTGATETSYNQPARITAAPTGAGASTPFTGSTTYTVEYSIAPSSTATSATVTAAKIYSGQWAQGSTGTAATDFSYVSTMGANKNQLQKFGLIFVVDTVVYGIDNCALDQASIAFGLDSIAMCAWTGKGTALNKLTVPTAATLATAYTANAVTAANKASYITNKLSTVTLTANIGGGGSAYVIPITGGNLTINNNIVYQTPTNLAVVNQPIGYYTGQRAISGNVTAYLRTGDSGNLDAGGLLSQLLTDKTTSVEPKFFVRLEMGGKSALNRVEFEMPAAVLQIPAVNIADVVATTINFNAQGFAADKSSFDVTGNNELIIRYFSNTSTA